MIIAVIGTARSGKSTFAMMLAEELNCPWADTSAWIVRTLEDSEREYWDQVDPPADEPDEPSRVEKVALGNAVTEHDHGFLVRQAYRIAAGRSAVWEDLAVVDQPPAIIAGIRRVRELETLPMGSVVVSVLDPRKELNSEDNFEPALYDHADHQVLNDWGFDELRESAKRIARHLYHGPRNTVAPT